MPRSERAAAEESFFEVSSLLCAADCMTMHVSQPLYVGSMYAARIGESVRARESVVVQRCWSRIACSFYKRPLRDAPKREDRACIRDCRDLGSINSSIGFLHRSMGHRLRAVSPKI